MVIGMITTLNTTLHTSSSTTRDAWLELAHNIATDGIEHYESAVIAIVAASTASRRGSLLARLVCDPRTPAIARERAFGRIAPDSDDLSASTDADVNVHSIQVSALRQAS